MKILYLGYYSTVKYNRNCSPAATTMMDYVAQSIKKCGYNITIISPAQCRIKCNRILDEQGEVKTVYLSSYGFSKGVIARAVNKIKRMKELYKELMGHIDKNTTLIVYHSLAYMNVLKKIRKQKKFRLILQVNEIYSDVTKDEKKRKKEIEWINSADAYIFSTSLLSKEIICKYKPYIVCLGTYKNEPTLQNIIKKEGEVHIIYAGTFDATKGGGYNAILSAKFIPSNYHLHICGFGNESQVNEIKNTIEETIKESNCQISYEGCLLGTKYINMLQNCDIGLSTQNPKAEYNSTSFPSKILSYMSNGLQVVSARIPAIESSPVGKYIYYYDEQTPEAIAEAIKRIDLGECHDMKVIIRNLDENFCEKIKGLLRE